MPEKEEYALDSIRETPSINARVMADDMFVSTVTVWRVLSEEGIQPFHLQKVQCLKDDDFLHCLDFVRWMMHKIMSNPQFVSLILFTEEASFTIEGIYISTLTMNTSELRAIST